MFHIDTLNDIPRIIAERGDRGAVQGQSGDGSWQTISGLDFTRRVQSLAAVLRQWGVGQGDRVAMLTENRWEWPIIDFATLSLGALDVPLYATVTAEQVGYMLRDSGAKVLFVSTQEQVKKLHAAGDLPSLERVVLLDDGAESGMESFAAVLDKAERESATNGSDRTTLAITPDDPATIIYTSGTTGEPKGVVLTHGNLAANLNVSTADFPLDQTDSCISFLPLSHVVARHVDYALLCHGVTLAYLPKFDQLAAAMKSVRPTVFVAVPRVYEKIRQGVESKAGGSAVRARVLEFALAIGRRQREKTLRGEAASGLLAAFANKLVFSKIREAFGGRVKLFIAGGAPLGFDTAHWFADAGVRILEGYGLTETSPVIAVNTPKASRVGSVGRPLSNVEARFAADGELEVRGASIFRSYWQHEKETMEAFTPDSWFKTGDIGKLEDGFLFITDRKKELLKTSGGKLIAPQPIENQLKANGLVAQAALVGDGQKFASVLVSPNFQALEGWAKGKGIHAGDHAKLVTDTNVQKLYQGIVDGVNGRLAPYETMKKVGLVAEEWTVEGGQLTPSMKLKRRVIEKTYADQIKSFYKE